MGEETAFYETNFEEGSFFSNGVADRPSAWYYSAISRKPDSSTFMGSTARIQHKGQVTIPTHVREQAGLSKGDVVEFSYRRGKIVVTPRVPVERSKFPNADDEYTPAQRRLIDARLAESEEDFKQGRTYGPFNTAAEMVAHMKSMLKKRALTPKAKRRR